MNIEATHLGKNSSYPQQYDPSVLVAVPRILNREQYGISNHKLPFSGVDVWRAWEFSFLTQKGLPVTGILKIVYPCNNEFLVESKSLKLYLNSFNMHHFGQTVDEGISQTVSIIQNDLQQLLKCKVEISFFNHHTDFSESDFSSYKILEEMNDISNIHFSRYTEAPHLLKSSGKGGKVCWGTHLLRSNCKITHQPDWGSLYLTIEGNDLPTPDSLLTYIVSLRNENHFHEEICEMVFKRLTDKFSPSQLVVSCLYTRRGGIDINPVRSNNDTGYPVSLTNPQVCDLPVFRQ